MSQVAGNQVAASARKASAEPFVPLWGVVIALLVIAALIVTIASNSVYGLDFFHVFGGAVWITIDLFMGFVIGPL